MRDLIVHDDRELRRIEQAIAALEQSGARLRTHCLLAALTAERAELLRLGARTGRRGRALPPLKASA
jgi:hypothetical protein